MTPGYLRFLRQYISKPVRFLREAERYSRDQDCPWWLRYEGLPRWLDAHRQIHRLGKDIQNKAQLDTDWNSVLQ